MAMGMAPLTAKTPTARSCVSGGFRFRCAHPRRVYYSFIPRIVSGSLSAVSRRVASQCKPRGEAHSPNVLFLHKSIEAATISGRPPENPDTAVLAARLLWSTL